MKVISGCPHTYQDSNYFKDRLRIPNSRAQIYCPRSIIGFRCIEKDFGTGFYYVVPCLSRETPLGRISRDRRGNANGHVSERQSLRCVLGE